MGMNLELKRSGVAFHIQTEDMGLPRGELVTQLFAGGVIIETLRLRYFDAERLPPRPPPPELQLRHQMRDQHLSLVKAVQAGRYDQHASTRRAQPQVTPQDPAQAPYQVSPPLIRTSPALSSVDQSPPPSQDQGEPALKALAPQPQAARETPTPRGRAPLSRAQITRELEQVQRGLSSPEPHELVEELLFTAQERYPDFKASLLALRVSAREALSHAATEREERDEEERS